MKKASWWRASLVRLGAAAPLGLFAGCYDDLVRPDQTLTALVDSDEIERQIAALKLQTEVGWNVGQTEMALPLVDAVDADVVGGMRWKIDMPNLVSRLRPWRGDLLPWNVPTLFQALVGKEGESLRAQMKPVHGRLDEDFGRGLALRGLFGGVGWPRDTAVVIDVPGARSVAMAAAMADHFDPVFTFGNWPHPLGVVPTQQALGAALYYLPVFDRAVAIRSHEAPPMWVLDSERLRPYIDEDTQFDNRYTVHLPDAAALKALGVTRLLYISDGETELDDLNQPFVALGQAGVEIRKVALSELERGVAPPELAAGDPPCEGEPTTLENAEDQPEVEPWFLQLSLGAGWFWWGGDVAYYGQFWGGWYPSPHWLVGPPGFHRRHAITIGPPPLRMRPLGTALYHPTPRGTVFSGSPTKIGHVTVVTARGTGTLLGVRSGSNRGTYFGGMASHGGGSYSGHGAYSGHGGYSGGRSGSFGRMGGGGMSG